VSYSGDYDVHMPLNGTNNASLYLSARSIRLVATCAFTSSSGYGSVMGDGKRYGARCEAAVGLQWSTGPT